MSRFALIDIYSGFVWGVTDAASPIDAARAVDTALNETDREYIEHGPNSGAERSGIGGYVVYEAPEGYDVEDGANPASRAATERLPRAAVIEIQFRDD